MTSGCRRRTTHPGRGFLALWAGAALSITVAGAAETEGADAKKKNEADLEEIVVTGSLIRSTDVQAFTPVLSISAQEIEARGFADVAEALQRVSFATGSVQNGQFYNGFTPGAKVTSFFGLDPSYTRYMINGLPFANYPALYNGTESFVSIAGIPTVLVDHIDVLPGGQSSIYGSDAIAGVVNVVMKTHLDGPMIDARYGFYDDGGGADRRIAIADGRSIGDFNVIAGAQYEDQNPIWGYQRHLTSQYYNEGSTPQTAEKDFWIFAENPFPNGSLYPFEDPANCANVASLWSHTVRPASQPIVAGQPELGKYCGTVYDGAFTSLNADEQVQFYLHSTYDVSERLQVYGDALLSHEDVRFSVGPNGFNSTEDPTSPLSYYEDPRLAPIGSNVFSLQHLFAPEESGGLNDTLNKNTTNSVRGTVGIKGSWGSSWTWLADMTYSDNRLTEATHLFFTQPIEAFFSQIYGPQIGYDPTLAAYIYEPNYAQFYKPITPAEYASFSGYATNYSYTEESMARSLVSSPKLFTLPGGDAGLALQVEGGDQGWNYQPDPRYLPNAAGTTETFGYTSTSGSGHRSRYAGTVELSLPIMSMLKADLSGRYDDYRVEGASVDKGTYNASVEFKPLKELAFRGRYGTAFKAPTLADEFQGLNGYYEALTDYYNCYKNGYTTATIGNCPYFNETIFGQTSGNTHLAPITAKVWDLGLEARPLERAQLTLDYIKYAIRDEVATADPNKILETEAACRLGQLDISSPTCVAALADVTRNAAGALVSVFTAKQNVSQENVGVFIVDLKYLIDIARYGQLEFEGSWTDMLLHTYQLYPGDPLINDLNDPFYSTEFKTKGNLAVTWTRGPLSATAYVEHYGRSPNFISQEVPEGYSQPGAGTVGVWTIMDLSVAYHPVPSLELSLAMNNVFNRMPPDDHSYQGTYNQPYNIFNYNVYGREYYLTASYHWGR
ncbi:MAG TPA: TonB-dependent receptor [Steroidobacteraceae bacterium]|nr:TonB-dependent receptor [Steroidobacteraceae bacterium]